MDRIERKALVAGGRIPAIRAARVSIRRYDLHDSVEELAQVGMIGILEAVESFDPDEREWAWFAYAAAYRAIGRHCYREKKQLQRRVDCAEWRSAHADRRQLTPLEQLCRMETLRTRLASVQGRQQAGRYVPPVERDMAKVATHYIVADAASVNLVAQAVQPERVVARGGGWHPSEEPWSRRHDTRTIIGWSS